jgi:WD40 repeat protein
LISASADGSLRLWDLETLEQQAAPSPALVVDLGVGALRAVAVSPDGAWAAAACADGAVRVVSLPTDGKLASGGPTRDIRTWPGHTEAVSCLAFTPDGKQLASGARDQTVRFWDVPSGELVATWHLNQPPTSVAFGSWDGRIAVADSATYKFRWKRLTETAEHWPPTPVHAGAVTQVHFTRVGHVLTASADGTLRLWEPNQFAEMAVAQGEFPTVYTAALRPDESAVAAGYADGKVRLWELGQSPCRDLFSGPQNAVFLGAGHRLADDVHVHDFARGVPGTIRRYMPGPIDSLAVHPDGRRFAFAGGAGAVEVWDRERRDRMLGWTADEQGLAPNGLAGSPDGAVLATAAVSGRVKLWDWATGKLVEDLDPQVGPVEHLAWCTAGVRLAVSGRDGTVLLRPGATGERRCPLPRVPPRSPLAFGAEALAFVAADGAVEILDAASGQPRRSLRGHQGAVTALAFSPGDRWLAVASLDGIIRLWDTSTGGEQGALKYGRSRSPTWLTFDPHGQYLLSGCSVGNSGSGATTLWLLPPRSGAAHLRVSNPQCGRFLGDGTAVLLGTESGSVVLMSAADVEKALASFGRAGQEVTTEPVQVSTTTTIVPGGHLMTVWGVAASPDGRWFATASHDQTVKLWDARSGRLERTLAGHKDLVWCAAFSPDSRHLASGGSGVKVWEVETGRELHDFQDHGELMVASVAFHPSGRWLASAGYDGEVHLRELPSGRDLGRLHRFEGALHNLAFEPGGRWLAVACPDFRVALWSCGVQPPAPGPPERSLAGHPGPVRAVRFSADGRYLASGSEGGMIILWDGATFSRIVRLKGGTAQIRGLDFSRDNHFLAGAAYQGPTIVWDLPLVRQSLREMGLDW